MLDLLLLFLAGLAIAWLLSVLATRHVLVHPKRRGYAWALARGRPGDPGELDPPLAFEPWTFRSRGRELGAWRIRGRDERGPRIIVTHGWGESRVTSLPRIAALAELARQIIAWDLPGHGDSPGACGLGVGEVSDLAALIGVLDAPIVLVGHSLGAGVSIAAGADPSLAPRVAGVIAEAPYRHAATPARAMMRRMGLPTAWNLAPALFLVRAGSGRADAWKNFDRAAHAAMLECPLLVIHGEDDRVSPVADGRAIASAARRGAFRPVPQGDHDQTWTPKLVSEVSVWLASRS